MKLQVLMAGALWLAGVTVAAHAQSPAESRAEIPSLVREAFASDYGKALAAELGKSLRSNADAACLATKAIAPDQLEARGRDLIVKWGIRTLQTANSFIDPKIYDEKFAAEAGRGGGAELARLRKDATVKRGLELEQPIRQAKILDTIFEQFDRYLLVKRIKLTAVSPLATGNEALLNLNPTEAAEARVDKFMAATKSPALKRYGTLSQQSLAASAAATGIDDLAKAGPDAFMGGIEADLAGLCIGTKQK